MITRVKYVGTTPGADVNVYSLFDTTVAGVGAGFLNMTDTHRVVVDLGHTQGGTFNWYRSDDGGAVWIQQGTEVVAAPAATETTIRDFLVEGCLDWKLTWTNGGVAQATWSPRVSLIDDRAVAV